MRPEPLPDPAGGPDAISTALRWAENAGESSEWKPRLVSAPEAGASGSVVGMKTVAWQAVKIVLLGVGLGLAANQISPRGLPLIPAPERAPAAGEIIPLDQARRLWDRGNVLFLDAREPDDYAAGHIGNALNLPAQSFAQHFGELAPILAPDSELVLYCDGRECELSHRLAEDLRQRGFTNLHLLANGWTAWRQAGLPTTPGGQK